MKLAIRLGNFILAIDFGLSIQAYDIAEYDANKEFHARQIQHAQPKQVEYREVEGNEVKQVPLVRDAKGRFQRANKRKD